MVPKHRTVLCLAILLALVVSAFGLEEEEEDPSRPGGNLIKLFCFVAHDEVK
jgi:hypothetical protein